jgi:hypothetical protein
MKPLQIVPFASDARSRIGGPSPDLGEALEPNLGYFFTVPHPVVADHCASVFISRNFDDQWDNRGFLLQGPPACRVVAHPVASGRTDGINASVLTAHGLALGAPEPDYPNDEQVWCHHKIGGLSALEVCECLCDETMDQIRSDGWEFWCQIAFPDADDDTVGGSWPVCDCLTAIYYRASDHALSAVWERL